MMKDTALMGCRNMFAVMAFFDCGLQANELANLGLEDVHADTRSITPRQGKGNKERFVPMGSTLHRYL